MFGRLTKVALVAGRARGAGRGIAVELCAAGATVYVTGRTARHARSEYGRPETIQETRPGLADALTTWFRPPTGGAQEWAQSDRFDSVETVSRDGLARLI